jgi:hypothetical protein
MPPIMVVSTFPHNLLYNQIMLYAMLGNLMRTTLTDRLRLLLVSLIQVEGGRSKAHRFSLRVSASHRRACSKSST